MIELLIAIAILAVITAMIYACFAAVVDSMARARADAEEAQRVQFLARNLEANFSAASLDLAALVSQVQSASTGTTVTEAGEGADFFGEDDETFDGPADRVTFISTAPLSNGMGLPGEMKRVSYSVLSPESDEMELSVEETRDEEYQGAMLQGSEQPITAEEYLEGDTDEMDDEEDLFEEEVSRDVGWSQPIKSMDIKYFDGEEWLDEWDSVEQGRLPWAVHVRINYFRTEAQEEAERAENYDEEDDPDFEMVISIARGAGFTEPAEQVGSLLTHLGTGTEGGSPSRDTDEEDENEDQQ